MNKFKATSDCRIDAGRRSLLCGMVGLPLLQMSGCGGGASGHESSVVTPQISPASQGADLPIIPILDGSVDAAGTRNFSLVAQAGGPFDFGAKSDGSDRQQRRGCPGVSR